MVFVDIAHEEPAVVDGMACRVDGTKQALVDRTIVEPKVFDVDLLVVDEAGERQVHASLLAEVVQLVVFPFDGNLEVVLLSAAGKHLLQNGDIVECRRVDHDTQHGIGGGRCQRAGEEHLRRVTAVAGECQQHGRVEDVVEGGVVSGGEVNLCWVVGAVATRHQVARR